MASEPVLKLELEQAIVRIEVEIADLSRGHVIPELGLSACFIHDVHQVVELAIQHALYLKTN